MASNFHVDDGDFDYRYDDDDEEIPKALTRSRNEICCSYLDNGVGDGVSSNDDDSKCHVGGRGPRCILSTFPFVCRRFSDPRT